MIHQNKMRKQLRQGPFQAREVCNACKSDCGRRECGTCNAGKAQEVVHARLIAAYDVGFFTREALGNGSVLCRDASNLHASVKIYSNADDIRIDGSD